MSAKDDVRFISENEAQRLRQVSLLMPLCPEDVRRLETLARVIRLLDGGDLPPDDEARSASIEALVQGLQQPQP